VNQTCYKRSEVATSTVILLFHSWGCVKLRLFSTPTINVSIVSAPDDSSI
jgi:hypothetical protein